jgi:antitoxin component YwqK of YwqJK toxin-antitoxin module
MKTLSQFHTLSLLALLCASLIMPLHAEEKVMDMDQLVVKGELRYVAEQVQPFTGNAVSYFANGMQKLQASFRNGLKHGKEIAWYEDGQLRYVVRYLNGEPQSVGSAWYARSSQADVAVSELHFCDEEDTRIGFCDSEIQESSRIEFTGKQESGHLEFKPKKSF